VDLWERVRGFVMCPLFFGSLGWVVDLPQVDLPQIDLWQIVRRSWAFLLFLSLLNCHDGIFDERADLGRGGVGIGLLPAIAIDF
jgi:hypothetical protein